MRAFFFVILILFSTNIFAQGTSFVKSYFDEKDTFDAGVNFSAAILVAQNSTAKSSAKNAQKKKGASFTGGNSAKQNSSAGGSSKGIQTGEHYFRLRKYNEAAVALQEEIKAGKIGENSFNMLALSFIAEKQLDKALDAFQAGLKNANSSKVTLYYNLGNYYYMKGEFEDAILSYTKALALDNSYDPALLNRANASLMQKDYRSALQDYKEYVKLVPNNKQSAKLTKVISSIEEQIASEAVEARKIAVEKARQEEEARQERERQKILEDMAASMQETDATTVTSDKEGALDYESEEGELD